ncbi:unnamed protein product [Calypogeia fissa]
MASRQGGNNASAYPGRRSQNHAQKAAAARLAQVMASHSADIDEDDDIPSFQRPSAPIGLGAGPRDASPRVPRRPILAVPDSRDQSPRMASPYRDLGTSRPATSLRAHHRPTLSEPHLNGTSQRSTIAPTPAPAPAPPMKFRSRPAEPSPETPFRESQVPLRTSSDPTTKNSNAREEAALQDEIDLLQEDNQLVLNKLRLAEEKLQEMENRNKELEKQIGSLGEGISLEARLLSRKEAALKQREAALRAEREQSTDMKDDEIAALRLEADAAKDEVIAASERSALAEREVQGLRSVTRRMILTHEEMEEMVLKRCWLARYWGLATRHGILAEVASSKHEHWSALAPLPLEVVISAGHSESNSEGGRHRKTPSIRDLNDITGEGNVEGMLAVEKGLREMALLKVEQSVMMAISRHHHPSLGRSELSNEEVEDIQFKHAWLVYFWRRAKNFNVEKDIADERLNYWMVRCNQPPTSHDVLDVERGLLELHKLGVEEQLWEASRREVSSRAGENHSFEVGEGG